MWVQPNKSHSYHNTVMVVLIYLDTKSHQWLWHLRSKHHIILTNPMFGKKPKTYLVGSDSAEPDQSHCKTVNENIEDYWASSSDIFQQNLDKRKILSKYLSYLHFQLKVIDSAKYFISKYDVRTTKENQQESKPFPIVEEVVIIKLVPLVFYVYLGWYG